MNIRREHLRTFEGLLVKEFRSYQTLFNLTLEERQSLSRSDVARLLALAEHKEALLDQLGRLEESRRVLLYKLERAPAPGAQPGEGAALATVLGTLDREEAGRIMHLQEGILVLMGQVRELTQGNRALAACALERASNLQAQLAGLWQIPLSWDRDAAPLSIKNDPALEQGNEEVRLKISAGEQISLPAVFATIVSVREALKARDQSAISSALNDLQDALDGLGKFLGARQPQSDKSDFWRNYLQEARPPRLGAPAPREETNLVEVMARLYRQEEAYQAVLRASNRMLTSA
jgi:flagellar biosynthesis/type III secretory pathway chaperone